MKKAIWWIRRDLRLNYNQTLLKCKQYSDYVIPLFILDPNLLNSGNDCDNRKYFLINGLVNLDDSLRKHGLRMIFRQGQPQIVLKQLLQEIDDGDPIKIFAEPDYSPYALRRDNKVMKSLPLELVGSTAYYPPGTVTKPNGEAYLRFTPFSNAWRNLPTTILQDNTRLSPNISDLPPELYSNQLPTVQNHAPELDTIPGEEEGRKKLANFTEGEGAQIYNYAQDRNFVHKTGTSHLSSYIKFGMLSIQEVVNRANLAILNAPTTVQTENAQTWLTELIWRDFYIHILYHFPNVMRSNFQGIHIRWENNRDAFNAWRSGQTGYPIIDAANRELLCTGWMHNRSRMLVASFLTKNLLIDWKWGENWFMKNLLDGDPASNNGGWQWSASTGTDATPYFRIFNPYTQSKKFDPEGIYIRRWVSELRSLPDKYIHTPHLMSLSEQYKYGCIIGKDYPSPIIDYNFSRQRALDRYQSARKVGKEVML
jgi:deoxyribodipyrimidine photo-lyase